MHSLIKGEGRALTLETDMCVYQRDVEGGPHPEQPETLPGLHQRLQEIFQQEDGPEVLSLSEEARGVWKGLCVSSSDRVTIAHPAWVSGMYFYDKEDDLFLAFGDGSMSFEPDDGIDVVSTEASLIFHKMYTDGLYEYEARFHQDEDTNEDYLVLTMSLIRRNIYISSRNQTRGVSRSSIRNRIENQIRGRVRNRLRTQQEEIGRHSQNVQERRVRQREERREAGQRFVRSLALLGILRGK